MLYLIDSSIYIFRAWQVLPADITNSHGEPANAVSGFADTLAAILASEQPAYIACAFDECHRSGVRQQIYPSYKSNRPPAPADLKVQFARCREVAAAMGIASFGSTRVEADDIIGQLAALAHDADMSVTIVSADKDLAQFIADGDCYWDFARKKRFNASDLTRRFKVKPQQIADWLALSGDKVDNIPGIPGIGPATAAKLLNKWGNLEVLLQNTEHVAQMRFRGAPRISQLLLEHADTARLARRLTGLITDDCLPRSLDSLLRNKYSSESLTQQLLAAGFSETHCARLARQLSDAAT